MQNCRYCNSLSAAFSKSNYCSNSGDRLSEVATNAFYFKTNRLNSGSHISRFSLRTLFDGYQYHKIHKGEYMLDSHHHLVVPEGQEFTSEIATGRPVDGVVIAYSHNDLSLYSNFISKNDLQLLDDPFRNDKSIDFTSRKTRTSKKLKSMLQMLRTMLVTKQEDSFAYQILFKNILHELATEETEINTKITSLAYKKFSTKKEIYRRVNIAKEYIDCNIHNKITLEELSHVAALSPFHFLRCFKMIYHITPLQYLTKVRLEKAEFLLKDNHLSLSEIIENIGFQSKSSFIRLYKSHFGITPIYFRKSHS